MTTYGPFYPGSAVNVSSGGVAWQHPQHAAGAPNGGSATASVSGEGVTDTLELTDFNATVPDDAVVRQVRFVIAPSPPLAGFNISDQSLAGTTAYSSSSGDSEVISDDAGNLSPAVVNDDAFGCRISLYGEHGGDASVESVALYVDVE